MYLVIHEAVSMSTPRLVGTDSIFKRILVKPKVLIWRRDFADDKQ
jgi:hypothetical protein